jgi:2',3'-cyclic-nucleotide 2'-phosphodiesterase (5'-nucleotidase family)
MRNRLLIILIVVIAVICVGVFAGTDSPPQSTALEVFYTATANGNLEPCGCPVNPSGGVSRRAHYINEQASPDTAILVIDGGDWVGPPTSEGLLQTEYMVRAMGKIGGRVVGVGPRDFAFGVEYLRDAGSSSGLSITCANVVDGETGEPILAPWVVTKVGRGRFFGIPYGGRNVGIISVMGPDVPPMCADCGVPLKVLPSIPSVRAAVAQIADAVDVIVVLASTPLDEVVRISAIPEVDVVIAARTLNPPRNYRNVGLRNGAVIAFTGYQARRIGHMVISFDSSGEVSEVTGDLVGLGQDMLDDKKLSRLVENYQGELMSLPGDNSHSH